MDGGSSFFGALSHSAAAAAFAFVCRGTQKPPLSAIASTSISIFDVRCLLLVSFADFMAADYNQAARLQIGRAHV